MKKFFTNKYRITFFTAIVSTVILIISCSKFLEKEPLGQITASGISSDPQAAVNLVSGVYNSLWSGEAFGVDVHSFNYVIMTEIASDNADKGSTPTDYSAALEIDNFTLTPTNNIVNNIWQGYYKAIARTNQALDQIPLSPSPQEQKDELSAQVRFLRAYFYFNLVRFYGGVPLIDKVPDVSTINTDSSLQTRAPADSIYSFIINDLEFASAKLLPKEQTQVGRATKAAAMSLLAKVYMYRKNWARVQSLTDSVIAGLVGSYDLYPVYADIWRDKGKNNVESIFEVQTGINAACNNAIQLFVVSQGPRGRGGWVDLGFGFNNPTADLVSSYEPNDIRKAGTIIFIDTSAAHTGTILWDGFRIPSKDSVENFRYSYKAYHSRTQEPNCGNTDYLPKNFRILRLGEVLLMNAEAANELGNSGPSETSLNRVRARAGLGAISGLAQAQMRDTIWHERRVELAEEYDRFFDIVRQGRAAQIMQAHGKAFIEGKHELFPIPQAQIDISNGKLLQNPGY